MCEEASSLHGNTDRGRVRRVPGGPGTRGPPLEPGDDDAGFAEEIVDQRVEPVVVVVLDDPDARRGQDFRAVDAGKMRHVGRRARHADTRAAPRRQSRSARRVRWPVRARRASASGARCRAGSRCIPPRRSGWLCSPPETSTHPTCRRPHAEREAISSAVAMKYSSHDGRSVGARAARPAGQSATFRSGCRRRLGPGRLPGPDGALPARRLRTTASEADRVLGTRRLYRRPGRGPHPSHAFGQTADYGTTGDLCHCSIQTPRSTAPPSRRCRKACTTSTRSRQILFWNSSAEHLSGHRAAATSRAAAVTRTCCVTSMPPATSCVSRGCPLAATIVDGQTREADVFLHHKDGHRQSVRVKSTARPQRTRAPSSGAVETVHRLRRTGPGRRTPAGTRTPRARGYAHRASATAGSLEMNLETRAEELRRYGWPVCRPARRPGQVQARQRPVRPRDRRPDAQDGRVDAHALLARHRCGRALGRRRVRRRAGQRDRSRPAGGVGAHPDDGGTFGARERRAARCAPPCRSAARWRRRPWRSTS